jgi:hypothetical protein
MLHFAGNMTQSRIHDWLTQLGVKISTGQIARWLSEDHEQFHAEAHEAYETNLAAHRRDRDTGQRRKSALSHHQ